MRRRTISLGAAVLAALALPALASTVVRMSNEDLAKRADTIFHGKCVETQARDAGSTIVTEYTFEVEDALKGSATAGKRFTFKALGGTLAGRGYAISGAATYKKDEEVLVFLDVEHEKTGCRHAIGLAQGKFAVKEEEADSKKKYLVRDLGGLTFVGADGKVDEKPQEEKKLYLEDFLKEVKGYLEKDKK